MKLGKVVQVFLADIGQEVRPDHAGIVHHSADRELLDDTRHRLPRCGRIGQIDFDGVKRRM